MWYSKKPIIALAPMADMTDSPFCCVCRKVAGSNFVIFKEMLSAEALVRDNEKTWKMGEFDEVERPIIMQLFGGDVGSLAKASECVAQKFNPDGIDINMGCPVPKITNRSGAGAALMKDHNRAVEIVKAIKKLNLKIPLSVKTRLGWSRPDEILEFAPKLEQAGADALTIHGRTKIQGYVGTADWEAIASVKKIVKIPVMANGDIKSTEDIKKCLEITGADGVVIGRAALGNPWIFSNRQPNLEEIKNVVLYHAEFFLKHYGQDFGLITFRKHLLAYFKGIPGATKIRVKLARVETLEELKLTIADF